MSLQRNKDYLPFFKSPLVDIKDQTSISQVSSHEALEAKSPFTSDVHGEPEPVHLSRIHSGNQPIFRQFHEATNSELFYDLFFVANLTVYTGNHEVNDGSTFRQFIGFFAVLWLAWYQVALYDVRFSMDSVVDRFAKALQFGVMIGFAVVGPQFDIGSYDDSEDGSQSPSWKSFKALSLILMINRLVLVFQYVQALCFTRRRHQETVVPLGAIAAVYAVSAAVYLGVYFSFSPDGWNNGFWAWYAVGLVETLAATAISSYWRIVSFKRTHLVQRMNLLTLIFLGEGIIGAARSASAILRSPVFGPTPIIIGNVVALVLVLYFLYMLYFDWTDEKHFGTIMQQIWAFLHFPLHLCLVVAVEGATQVLQLTAAVAATDGMTDTLVNADLWNTTENAVALAVNQLEQLTTTISGGVIAHISTNESLHDWLFQQSITAISLSTLANITDSDDNRSDAFGNLYSTLYNQIFLSAGFSPPEGQTAPDFDGSSSSIEAQTDDSNDQIYYVFALVYAYFFIAVGLVVIFIGIMASLSKSDKRLLHWVRLGVNLFVGIGLCLVSAVVNGYKSDDISPYDNFIATPLILPTVTIALFLAVALNNINVLRLKNLTRIGRRRDDAA